MFDFELGSKKIDYNYGLLGKLLCDEKDNLLSTMRPAKRIESPFISVTRYKGKFWEGDFETILVSTEPFGIFDPEALDKHNVNEISHTTNFIDVITKTFAIYGDIKSANFDFDAKHAKVHIVTEDGKTMTKDLSLGDLKVLYETVGPNNPGVVGPVGIIGILDLNNKISELAAKVQGFRSNKNNLPDEKTIKLTQEEYSALIEKVDVLHKASVTNMSKFIKDMFGIESKNVYHMCFEYLYEENSVKSYKYVILHDHLAQAYSDMKRMCNL